MESLNCSYDPAVKKRGLSKGYVRGLENLFALSLRNIDGFEESVLDTLMTAASLGWSTDAANETLHGIWKTSRLFGEVKELLQIPNISPASVQRKILLDPPGNTPYQHLLPDARDSTLSSLDDMSTATTSSIFGASQARVSQDVEYRSNAQPPRGIYTRHYPPGTLQLLEIYFAVVHPWFPIVIKNNVLRDFCLLSRNATPILAASPGSSDHAIVWAILSYTVNHSLASPPGDDAALLSLAKEYHAVSRNLIPSEKERCDLGHVQALLLLTLVSIGLEDWTGARLLRDQAARMAIGMDLGTPPSTPGIKEQGLERTVFLACFVIDSLLSFRLSHIPSMLPFDLAAVCPSEDGLNVSSSCVGSTSSRATARSGNPLYRKSPLALCCFRQLVELALVLNKISRTVWAESEAANLAHEFLMELKRWEDCVLQECTLNQCEDECPEQQMALLPYQSYVCLTHIATLLWLYLRLIPGSEARIHCSGQLWTGR
jgi:hypothetical protein